MDFTEGADGVDSGALNVEERLPLSVSGLCAPRKGLTSRAFQRALWLVEVGPVGGRAGGIAECAAEAPNGVEVLPKLCGADAGCKPSLSSTELSACINYQLVRLRGTSDTLLYNADDVAAGLHAQSAFH